MCPKPHPLELLYGPAELVAQHMAAVTQSLIPITQLWQPQSCQSWLSSCLTMVLNPLYCTAFHPGFQISFLASQAKSNPREFIWSQMNHPAGSIGSGHLLQRHCSSSKSKAQTPVKVGIKWAYGHAENSKWCGWNSKKLEIKNSTQVPSLWSFIWHEHIRGAASSFSALWMIQDQVTSFTMGSDMNPDSYCTRALCSAVTRTRLRLCLSPTFSHWNCSAEAALLPPQKWRGWLQSSPQLAQQQECACVPDHAGFIVSEGMTRATKDPFHIISATHKLELLYSTVNLDKNWTLFSKHLEI